MGAFNFGFNIGGTNLPTPLIKEFYTDVYFGKFKLVMSLVKQMKNLKSEINNPDNDMTTKIFSQLDMLNIIKNLTESGMDMSKMKQGSPKEKAARFKMINEKIVTMIDGLWTLTTALFVVGGAIGALTSKYVAEYMGRKKGLLFHYFFSIAAAILAYLAPYYNRPEFVMTSRFLYGIQGGKK